MIGLTAALDGLLRAEQQFDKAASDIARAPLALEGRDSVDLSAAAVALLQSRNNFEANTKIIKTADEMDQTLIDMLG